MWGMLQWRVVNNSTAGIYRGVRRGCSTWKVIPKQGSLIGRRTVVIAPDFADFDEMLGKRMQYELQKAGIQAGLFHCQDRVPSIESIREATLYARRTGVTSIVAVGPVGVIDLAKCVKLFLEQDNAEDLQYQPPARQIPLSQSPRLFSVPLLAFPTSYSYMSCQPTAGAVQSDHDSEMLRFISPAPDFVNFDGELISDNWKHCPILGRLDDASTARLFHCTYLAKIIDLCFSALCGLSTAKHGTYDSSVIESMVHKAIESDAMDILSISSPNSLRHQSTGVASSLYKAAEALSKLTSEIRTTTRVNCRVSLLETVAIMTYMHQTFPKKSITPYPVKMLTVLDRFLMMACDDWSGDCETLQEREDRVSRGVEASADADQWIKTCAVESVRLLCSTLKCSEDDMRGYVRDVLDGIPMTRSRMEKSAISAIIENTIAHEEGELMKNGNGDASTVVKEAIQLTIMKSDIMYDLAEEVL